MNQFLLIIALSAPPIAPNAAVPWYLSPPGGMALNGSGFVRPNFNGLGGIGAYGSGGLNGFGSGGLNAYGVAGVTGLGGWGGASMGTGGLGGGAYGLGGGGWGIGVNKAAVGLAAYGYALNGGQFGAAATPESVGIHSIADMVRSEGEYNSATSDALQNVEQARGKFIDNQKHWTEVFLDRRRALLSEHAVALEEIRSRNLRHHEESANHSDLPSRLGTKELNENNGFVGWPSALMRDAFVTQRSDIESLLAERAREGATSELSASLAKKTREMQEELRAHIREIVPAEYLEARRFLARLALEGLQPKG